MARGAFPCRLVGAWLRLNSGGTARATAARQRGEVGGCVGNVSEHFKAATDGAWPAKALEAYRASAVSNERITDAHFQHLFDWACMDWPRLSPLALAIWIGQNHQLPTENIDNAIKILFPEATEQQLLNARSEVAQTWKDRLAD